MIFNFVMQYEKTHIKGEIATASVLIVNNTGTRRQHCFYIPVKAKRKKGNDKNYNVNCYTDRYIYIYMSLKI